MHLVTLYGTGPEDCVEMRKWCEQIIGKTSLYLGPDLDCTVRILHKFGDTTFYFNSELAYNWFMLRWG